MHAVLPALLALLVSAAAAANLRINAGGPFLQSIGFRADTGKFASASRTYVSTNAVAGSGSWTPVYQTHRYAVSGDLVYTLPVPNGKYALALMFSEVYFPAKGQRVFDIKLNGVVVEKNVDVLARTGGKNKILYIFKGSVAPLNNKLTITIVRIAGKDNPFLSGINLIGEKADSLVGGEGLSGSSSTTPTTPTVPTASTAADPTCAGGKITKKACCPAACSKCGGKGCFALQPKGVCCVGIVSKSGRSCDNVSAPCILSATPVTTTTAQTVAPTTGVIAGCSSSSGVTGAYPTAFRMNTGGGPLANIGWGADNTAYIVEANKGLTSTGQQPVVSGSWGPVYITHRYTTANSLTYKIPVPAGTYKVVSMHSETYFKGAGQRKFNVKVNGVTKANNLDVYAATGGANKALFKSYPGITSVGGFISISFTKVVQNPMVSGIFISGNGAGSVARGGSSDPNCGSTDLPTTTPTTIAPTQGGTNSGFNHRAHAVPGGPYIAVDFNGDGSATIDFDGSLSHSHYSDPGPPPVVGKIVAYKWAWKEDGVMKTNTATSGKFSALFPLGVTQIALTVTDSSGSVATDTTTVEVRSSTTNGAYCYYYKTAVFPLPPNLVSGPAEIKPLYASRTDTVNFDSVQDMGDFSFSGDTFVVRCVFYINTPSAGAYTYKFTHLGPLRAYSAGVLLASSDSKTNLAPTTTKSRTFTKGLQAWQIQYLREKGTGTKLQLMSASGAVLDKNTIQHDESATLPVIASLSKTGSSAEGGENIQIYGSGFINGVSVSFGGTIATNLISSDAGTLQVTVPPGQGVVQVTVSTNAGISNSKPFTYGGTNVMQPIKFTETKLKNADGKSNFAISQIAAAVYGPDGRLYLGAINSKVYALTIGDNYAVVKKCEKTIGTNQAVLGIAFNPKSNDLKLYFTTSVIYWKDKNLIKDFGAGWTNGKIRTVTTSGPTGCFRDDVKDLISGLPISNHDHAVNSIQFLPNGKMLIGVGGFTNGGVSVAGDLLGGVASNPLSAAIIECPVGGTTVQYSNLNNPVAAKIISGGCKTYADGFRNSFDMTFHTNNKLYATDNGPNQRFGAFSTDCNGGSKPGANLSDKLFLVKPGTCHGHPNLNRKQCVYEDPACTEPIIYDLESSTNGILEYRSSTFGGQIKGNLFLAKFAGQHAGKLSRVVLDGSGKVAKNGYFANFFGASGLSLVEGPRGELIMPRVYRGEVVVLYPNYPAPSTTFLIGVHPKVGPQSGNSVVLLSGHNFGMQPSATFGGKPCTAVTVISDSAFSCKTPAGSVNQQVKVVVSGTTGDSPTYGVSDFWYY